MPRIRGGENQRQLPAPGPDRAHHLALAITVFVLMIGVGVGLGAKVAVGDEAPPVGEPTAAVPTAQETEEALEEATTRELVEGPATDPQVAEELPHRDLDGDQALELAEGVFGAQLEDPAGIFDELEAEKFLSDYAAVVSASTLPESSATDQAKGEGGGTEYEIEGPEAGQSETAGGEEGPLLIESTLPLRTENAEGKAEAVDLTLQSPKGSGGELQPLNPLTELAIPAHLGEGITVGNVEIAVAGAAPEAAPTNVAEQYAFYPNVAENTDLVVAPTPIGAETMTTIRSAEAPTTTTYELSLPDGAELKATDHGGAEVTQGGRTTMAVAPPSAIDAAGEPVPVELEVEGQNVRVVASPGPEASYPILVDPEFIQEAWYWSSNHDSLAAWTSSTTQWTICPWPYAYWIGNHTEVPGLGLIMGCDSNPVSAATHADWSYLVPRYQSDMAKYKTPPTSTVFQLYTQGVIFLTHGNENTFPKLVWGITNPSGGGWVKYEVHQGGQGEMTNWNWGYASTNEAGNPGAKGADVELAASSAEATAPWREAFVGEAIVSVADGEPPVLKKLEAPTKWLNTTAEPIKYEVEDTGLGVKAAWASFEDESDGVWTSEPEWGFPATCQGTVASPCPRVVNSAERTLTYDPKAMPTGEDKVSFAFGDVVFWPSNGAANHAVGGSVTVKIDHTAPEVTLSGSLTEQEKLGITKSEYPLTIKATDGNASAPQSGVAKVEVKVDGKLEKTLVPGCANSDNCAFSGSWTLEASKYSATSHEVEVLVTDAAGIVTSETVEIDLGEPPPQTSFTSPHPSREMAEVETISFKATRGGVPVEGATFRCSLDGAAPESCPTPFELPEHFEQGEHIFTVAAVDKGGKADPTPATWKFETDPYPTAPANEKLIFPEEGKITASYYTLEAEWGANPEGKAGEGVTGVTFQMHLAGRTKESTGKHRKGETVPTTFETVPAECVIDGQGRPISWPLPVHTHPGHNAPVYLRVRGCPAFEDAHYPEAGIQFRAVFDGGKQVVGASAPVTTEFVSRVNANRVATDATELIGPATVDLLTGAFTVSRTDVSIPVPGYEANLEFGRTYSSTIDKSLKGYSAVLGGAWQPSTPLEAESEGQAWSRIVEQDIPEHQAVWADECWEVNEELDEQEELEQGFDEGFRIIDCPNPEHCGNVEMCEEWEEEPFQPHEHWIELLDNEGAAVIFEIVGNSTYVSPEYAKEIKLTKDGNNFILAYPTGSRNIFIPNGSGGREWLPKYVTFQATPSSMRLVFETGYLSGKKLVREIAPAPSPIQCEYYGEESTNNSEYHAGCRTLKFEYKDFNIPGHYFPPEREKLIGITYYGPAGGEHPVGTKVAEYTYQLLKTGGYPAYGGTAYEQEEMLVAESDPRLAPMAEWYAYDERPGYGNLLAGLDPPGQEAWGFDYEYGEPRSYLNAAGLSRLKAVKRAGTKTTLAYGVPTHGPAAPYDMGSDDISKWGQSDLPVDATAVFPPNHVPSEYPPHDYTGATIHYMDPEGYEVNTASPSPPGVSGESITTTETDIHGNVVRELSAANRLLALESSESASVSHQLDSHSVYNTNGTEMLESWGPLHEVRLESTGETGVQARQHTTIRYDEGAPPPEPGTPPAYLPTKETVAAAVWGKEGDVDPRVTETRYDWPHRLPTETIVDPAGLKIRTVTVYNGAGQVIETRQPKGANGGTAGDTRTIYYSTSANEEFKACGGNMRLANLPCLTLPAKQESGTGRPELLRTSFTAYNNLDEPTTIVESPNGGVANQRITTTAYDAAGRPVSTKITGGGTELARTQAKTETVYDTSTGAPNEQKFVCESACTGFDNQATKTTYNNLGQVASYEDADGAKTEMKYDAYGRPSGLTDPRGTQTLHYDEASGVLASMEVSGVGTFTAAYDADGDLIRRGLPNGLTATTSYNQAGEPMKLAYTKTSSCGESCTWYEESLERSIEGRILYDSSKLVENLYYYDKAGRLTEARETPKNGEGCTTRAYTFDEDSNRLTKTTRAPGVGGACVTSGVAPQTTYTYDEADRLNEPTYDPWGRITVLPGEFAGGKELKTSYFANEMVATQEQNGVTNTFQLDATGRQRQREQAAGVASIEVFHYDGSSDSPSWTSQGSTWSRSVPGIGGELAAVQESNGTTTFKLTDLHGDVVASASSNPTETKLLATFRFSEFGEPLVSDIGRYGWLGGDIRRSELPSGVIQMGVRSYVPQLGRFLTPDPVLGGSANAYDYANQDPVNAVDLAGTKAKKKHPKYGLSNWAVAGKKLKVHVTNEGHRTVVNVRAEAYGEVNYRLANAKIHIRISGGTLKATSPGTVVDKGFRPTASIASTCVNGYCEVEINQSVEFEAPCAGSVAGVLNVEYWLSWTSANGASRRSEPETMSYPVEGGVICYEDDG
jgi:RHS repeat-associated protein